MALDGELAILRLGRQLLDSAVWSASNKIQDQSQNSRALCIVEILCRLPYLGGHPTIDVLISSIDSVAAALVRMKRSLPGIVTDPGLLADRRAPILSIRLPPDIVRDPVPNPG